MLRCYHLKFITPCQKCVFNMLNCPLVVGQMNTPLLTYIKGVLRTSIELNWCREVDRG